MEYRCNAVQEVHADSPRTRNVPLQDIHPSYETSVDYEILIPKSAARLEAGWADNESSLQTAATPPQVIGNTLARLNRILCCSWLNMLATRIMDRSSRLRCLDFSQPNNAATGGSTKSFLGQVRGTI